MFDRFSIIPLIKNQLSLMTDRSTEVDRPDWAARAILSCLPLAAGVATVVLDWSIEDPGGLLAGFGILAATLIALFVQLAAWRLRLTDRESVYGEVERRYRDSVDEASYHTLGGSLVAAAGAVAVVVGTNVEGRDKALHGLTAAVPIALGVLLVLLFLLIVNLSMDAYDSARERRREGQRH